MGNEVSTLGITLPSDKKYFAGIGYIALPSDIDRATYISDCFKNFRVSVSTAHDGFMNRVQISQEDLNLLIFPEVYSSLGSPVLYIVDPTNNQPFITKVFTNKNSLGNGKEYDYKISKKFGNSFFEISGNPDKGYLNLVINNDTNAELNLVINNKNDKGALNLKVKGDIVVNTTGNNNFNQNGLFHSKTVNASDSTAYTEIIQSDTDITQISETSSINADKGHEVNSDTFTVNSQTETDINSPLIKINSGDENFILGQKLKSFLTDLINEIAQSTVATSSGTTPLINAEQISAYVDRIDECLSTKAFIDK